MKKVLAKICLKLIDFGLFVMNLKEKSEYDKEDHANVAKLLKIKSELEEMI